LGFQVTQRPEPIGRLDPLDVPKEPYLGPDVGLDGRRTVSIHKRTTTRGVRYDVRVRDHNGRVHNKTFRTRREAEAFERDQLARRDRGTWTDPSAARTPFDEWARLWLGANPGKRPKTLVTDRNIVERHLIPALGGKPLGSIAPADVQRLVADLGTRLAPATVRRYYAVLRAILTAAVEADLIGRTPCRGIHLPAIERRERHVLTPDEVRALAAAIPARYRAMILLAVETGLRFEECAALRVGRLSLLGARPSLTVAETAVEAAGRLHFGPPKSSAGRRTMALSKALRDVLAAHLAAEGITGADRQQLVFTGPDGGPLRYSNFRYRVWLPALGAAGLENVGLGFHDLRRASATTMVLGGVDVRTAQHRLGHSDPRLTLGVYAQVTTEADRAAAEAFAGFYETDDEGAGASAASDE
jgi:integrase